MIHAHLFRLAVIPALSLVVFLTSGCMDVYRSGSLQEMDISYGGEQPPGFWEAVPETPAGQEVQLAHKKFTWLLPYSMYLNQMRSTSGGEGVVTDQIAWNDLTLPIFTLPLRVYYARTYYDKGSSTPAGKVGFYAWPLYANSFERGDVPSNYTFDADGIPLLFSRLSIQFPPNVRFFAWNSAWSLGPAFLSIKSTKNKEDLSVKVFVPLLLLGTPGLLLWSDFYAKQEDTTAIVHGPLFGMLGYANLTFPKFEMVEMNEEEVAKARARAKTNGSRYIDMMERDESEGPTMHRVLAGTTSYHHLVGGALWMDKSSRDREGNLESAKYGPLWSAFGWQTEEGRFGLRFLWIPIRF